MTRRRIISLAAFSTLVAILLGGSLYLRNFLLSQVRKRIQSVFAYDRIRFRVLPPSLILDDVRTVSLTPFFSARQVSVSLPLSALLKNQRPVAIVIDEAILRIAESETGGTKKDRSGLSLSLPFALDRATVNGGEVHFFGKTISAQIKGLKVDLRSRGELLILRAEAEDSSLWLGSNRAALSGKINLHASGHHGRLEVDKLVFHGPPVAIRARGTLSNFRPIEAQFRVSFSAEMNALAEILGLPFEWKGELEGEGDLTQTASGIRFFTSLTSGNLRLNDYLLEKVEGTLERGEDSGFALDLNIRRKGGDENLSLQARSGNLRGEFQRFHLDPVFSYLALPWPVSSPAWGSFSLDQKRLQADIEFRDPDLRPRGHKYPLRGPVRVAWNLRDEVELSSPELEASFGRMEVTGKVAPAREVDLVIRGDVEDVKEGRSFASLILPGALTFPEIRGRGRAIIQVKGEISRPDVRIDFDLSPAGLERVDVAAAKGSVEVRQDTVFGRVDVEDPLVGGQVEFISRGAELDVDLSLIDGDAQRVFSWLDLKLPLRGRAGGEFQVKQQKNQLSVEGSFTSQNLDFGGQSLSRVEGELSWNPERLEFRRLSFEVFGGKVIAASSLELSRRKLELDLEAEHLDLSSFHPSLSGTLFLELRRASNGEAEAAAGNFRTRNLLFKPFQPAETEGEIKLRLFTDALGLEVKGRIQEEANPFSVEAKIPLTRSELDVEIKGRLGNLDLLLPWKGAQGNLNYLVQVRGIPPAVDVSGGVDLQGLLLPFPQFAHALEDFAGLILIKNNVFSVRSFRGKLGGGNVQGAGEVRLGKGGVETIDLAAEGENLLLSPLERTRALTDVSLRLIKNAGRFLLEGDVSVRRLSWRREIGEKFAFSSRPFPSTQRQPGFFDDLMLNLRLRAEDNAWMDNSLGRVRGRFDLAVSGSIRSPIVLGTIETLSGDVFFQDRKFQLLKGRLSFVNPTIMVPHLDFRGETYVKDYRVTFALTGFADQLKPEFSSSPPLPSEDVLALLALGEAFKRSYSAERSTQLSTASLLSSQLTGGAARRAEELFRLDRFRIDPFLMGSSAEMTARLTVGKKISRDFYIYYSTNLTKQTEEIIRLEWDVSRGFSLVGTRNEFGRVSFDVKIRRRF